MVARPRLRRSRLARWSWWLALLSLPVIIGGAVAHRRGSIDAPTLFMLLGAGFCLAFAALLAALVAFAGIWRDGRLGFGAALRGFILSALVLALPAWAAAQIVLLPRLSEVSTDLVRPPAFAFDPVRPGPSEADALLQRRAYPDLAPRRYPLDTRKVFDEARKLVTARGWQVQDLAPPAAPGGPGRIGALARTALFALPLDVAIRLEADGTGTRVDMRSASRYGAHDLGVDAALVRKFLADLDTAIAAAE